jgi:DHA2 family multidrug resistance protein
MSAPAVAAEEVPPLEGVERMVGAIVLSGATFMTVLDVTVANVSIPTIAGDLGVSPTQGTWIITSYAVANAIAMPLTSGRSG